MSNTFEGNRAQAAGGISVVVISLNEGKRLRSTVRGLQKTLPADSEILVVDDGSVDGSTDFLRDDSGVRVIRTDTLGVAAARNLGARETKGEIIIFCDAHVALSADWWKPLATWAVKPKVGAVSPAICDLYRRKSKGFGLSLAGPELRARWLWKRSDRPFKVPVLPGCCLAMRREVFDATGGFDTGMIGLGGNDNELCVRLWLLGYELWVIPKVEVAHFFRERTPYHVEWNTVVHNKLRLAFVHFHRDRIVRVIEALRAYNAFPLGLALTVDSDVAARRAELHARRLHDDDWFFRKVENYW